MEVVNVRSGGAPTRILVIEDNKDSAAMLGLGFQLLGYEVRLAYTGPDGLQQALAWQPDIVLCDIGLPGLNGYEVAEAIRAHEAMADTQLVALSAYGSEEDQAKGREAGFDGYCVKPMCIPEIHQYLTTCRRVRTVCHQ
jgi:CheY-like chemotaxis protein